MKKIILLLFLPFIIKAQKPVEDKNKQIREAPAEISNTTISKSHENTRALIESYRERVIKGEDMGDLAKLYSEDPGSAKEGGLIENVPKGMMVSEFESVALSLKPGEVSEVFETKYGFHFIKLLARRGDVVDLRHILLIPK